MTNTQNYLQPADVRIAVVNGFLKITCTSAAYEEVKKILLNLQDLYGLPVQLVSEMVKKPEVGNVFAVYGEEVGARTNKELSSLAEQLKTQFEQFGGLSVRVMPAQSEVELPMFVAMLR